MGRENLTLLVLQRADYQQGCKAKCVKFQHGRNKIKKSVGLRICLVIRNWLSVNRFIFCPLSRLLYYIVRMVCCFWFLALAHNVLRACSVAEFMKTDLHGYRKAGSKIIH